MDRVHELLSCPGSGGTDGMMRRQTAPSERRNPIYGELRRTRQRIRLTCGQLHVCRLRPEMISRSIHTPAVGRAARRGCAATPRCGPSGRRPRTPSRLAGTPPAVAATRYHRARCTGWRPLSHGGNASGRPPRPAVLPGAGNSGSRIAHCASVTDDEYTAQPCPPAAWGGHDGHGEIGDDGIVSSWSGRGLGNHRPNQEPTSSVLREAHARPSRVLKHSLSLRLNLGTPC